MPIDEAITTEIEYSQPCDIICKDGADCNDCRSYHRQLVEWLEELKQYRAIGTPEKCRAAVEKQAEKKVLHNEKAKRYFCPICERKCNYMHSLYCSGCGQKLDWSDEE